MQTTLGMMAGATEVVGDLGVVAVSSATAVVVSTVVVNVFCAAIAVVVGVVEAVSDDEPPQPATLSKASTVKDDPTAKCCIRRLNFTLPPR